MLIVINDCIVQCDSNRQMRKEIQQKIAMNRLGTEREPADKELSVFNSKYKLKPAFALENVSQTTAL